MLEPLQNLRLTPPIFIPLSHITIPNSIHAKNSHFRKYFRNVPLTQQSKTPPLSLTCTESPATRTQMPAYEIIPI